MAWPRLTPPLTLLMKPLLDIAGVAWACGVEVRGVPLPVVEGSGFIDGVAVAKVPLGGKATGLGVDVGSIVPFMGVWVAGIVG